MLRNWLSLIYDLVYERTPRVYYSSRRVDNALDDDSVLPVDLVVSRGLCQFLCVDMAAVKIQDRKEALRLQVTRVSPFVDFAMHVQWANDFAQIWFWDTAALGNGQYKVAQCFPASIFVPRAGDGDLVRYEDGIESRVWGSQGETKASAWWHDPPTEDQLREFSRGAGSDSNLEFVQVTAPASFDDYESRNLQESDRAGIRHLSALILVFFAALMFTWDAIGVVKNFWTLHQLERDIAVLEESSEEQLEHRAAAYGAQDFVRQFNLLQPFPTQLQLMSTVSNVLRDEEFTIRAWKFNGDSLQLVLSSDSFELLHYANAFEASPVFSSTDVQRGRKSDELVINLGLKYESP